MNICTVLIVTYNHQNYIEKALNSILNQETEFKYIVKIFDDCSTDKTTEILKKYKEKYPNKIKLYINKKNKGAQANFWKAYKSVDTKYCAILEGDDYWSNTQKLDLQINALEKHPECSFCSHQTIIENHDKLREFSNQKPIVTNQKVLNNNIISFEDIENEEKGYISHISSRVLRMDKINIKAIKYKEAFLYDNCQYHYMFLKGKMYFINETMSCHVQTGCGDFSSKTPYERIEKHTKALMEFLNETNSAHREKIIKELHYFMNYYFRIMENNGENK